MLPRKACKLHMWNCNLPSGSISTTSGGTICASRGKDGCVVHCNCFWFARETEEKDEKVRSGLHFRSLHKLGGMEAFVITNQSIKNNRVRFWCKKSGCSASGCSAIGSDGLHCVACIRLLQVLYRRVEISLTDQALPPSILSKNQPGRKLE